MNEEEKKDKKNRLLQVITKEDINTPHESQSIQSGKEGPQTHQQRKRAYWDRLWLTNSEEAIRASEGFQGELERQRVESIWSLLTPYEPYTDKRVVDLGCGSGKLTLALQGAGARVDAVDLSNLALRHVERQQALAAAHKINVIRAYVPYTELEDATYDLVLCSGLMGDLSSEEQRVLIAEMYRLAKPEGYILAASSIDTTTDGALEKWHRLLETELEIVDEHRLYHAYFLALLRMGKNMPKVFQGFYEWLATSECIANWLAARCQSFRGERGVSHVATLARRKPLQYSGEAEKTSLSTRDQRLKRRIWE